MIQTASGPVDAADLGRTVMHEHVFINLLPEFRGNGLLNDADLAQRELEAFRAAGGGTIVDLTSAELTVGASPDPLGLFRGEPHPQPAGLRTRAHNNVIELRELARTTGVNIVLGTGHYRDPYLDDFDRFGPDLLAERMVGDLTEGFPGTGVRAGVIGEIGSDRWYLSAAEERSFRAAARAQLATGVVISTHASRWPVGLAQLDVLVAEGADPRRVIIGHCDSINIPEYHLALAERGVYVQFDTVRGENRYEIERRARYVLSLVRAGYGDHVLLSQDVCRKDHLATFGGPGYSYVLGGFAEELLAIGLEEAEIERLVVDNPRAALASS
ncbi:MAG: hypothetical protein KF727_03335 [Microbacteriaceae bacterium]|nr:hypothetical protein [Microbacteriaceae bacterium]